MKSPRNHRPQVLLLTALMGLSLQLPAWSQTSSEPVAQINFQIAQTMAGRNIAVVDFSNDTGMSSYDNLKRGLSESLMTKLAKRPELTLVERNQLDKALKELGFAQSVYASNTQAKEIGKMAGADYLVSGSIVKAGNRLEINVRMLEVETAKVLVSESYTFESDNDTLMVVDYLSLLIPQKLGLYVSDRELEMAKARLKGQGMAAAAGDNSWIWWTLGGVVVVGAAVAAAVALSRPPAVQNNNNNITIGGDDSTSLNPDQNAEMPLNIPLLSF